MRLLTRSDFDGLICAVLLTELGIVNEYKFVHPKVIQDGKLKPRPCDVMVDMPYAAGCGLWFDHNITELERLKTERFNFKGDCRPAPSTAQVIWDYYGCDKAFGMRFLPMLKAVNRFDAGVLTKDEILNPKGWILISFLIDPRTGLGRIKDFRMDNMIFMQNMIQYCRTMTEEEILLLPDVKERVDRYFEHQEKFKDMLSRCAKIEKNLILINLMNEDMIYCGNRFLSYIMYPEQNIEIRVMQGANQNIVVITCGHSIINRTSRTNVSNLMLKYGGGGHLKAGTCQVYAADWERILKEIIDRVLADG